MKIRDKLLASMLLILLISGFISTLIWYGNSRKLSDRYLNDVSKSTMEYAYNAFEYLLTDTEYMATLIATNDKNIIGPVEELNDKSGILMQNGQWTRDYLDNSRLIEEYIKGMYGYKYYIAGIAVLAGTEHIFSSGQITLDKEQLYQEISAIDKEELRYSMVMLDPIHLEGLKSTVSSDYVVPAVRGIVDREGDINGFVVLYFDYGVIEQIFSVNLPQGSYFKVINRQGAEIFSNTNTKGEFGKADESYVENTFSAHDVGWDFYMGIPSGTYTGDINKTVVLTGVIIGLIIMASVILCIVSVSKMTGEITVLKEKMTAMADGDMDVRYEVKSSDEIGEMGHTFNYMAVRIKELMGRVADEEKQKRLNEIAFLQAQINPHFISNVLNKVVWMARIHHADNLIPLVNSLNHLLYSAMHQEKDMIPLSDELQYVDNYITIMEYSGNYDFCVEKCIAEETIHLLIPRFILQPIVENAICHGLDQELTKQGCIKITAEIRDGLLYIVVEDNGKGMDEKKITELLGQAKDKEHGFNGIGVRNVNERIKLFLGEDYGIAYESVQGQYTKCVFRLPIVEKSI